ncbi:beta-1,3-galactosyltransferase 1-like [Contarinia nasturtii]|uniref:beta-1,3-galactosyltransferase 1-like n=1 Tax=Contarinia nasturtii TaxID=265458 RepID=UPI0012D3B5E4|nr:beta-1,3-galactosyltransferase 1-like [Contarinia nasturtii]XP_031639479.1 beta-1,3-galactosyltransferase 1-like [Contarinia nasturtii]XP_031639480.1 beta-1,3-galactosyltransferase 1-like [Contarinia nasturtii]XP_031639501.1 beta-1,3-galactosyltransferase 1-like [Contarinia nasturtii]XP_031639502.1 beta-1,3-galactosyltransferase 1-like [Contarinia nasturtii]
MDLIDESDDDAGSDTSTQESCTLVRNDSVNKTDAINRRISNYIGDSRHSAEYNNFEMLPSHKLSRRNKYLKLFLCIFGFSSTLIILSQIYLSLYLDGSAFGLNLSVSGWDRNQSRSIPFYILPDENTTILEPSSLCKGNSPILLLIVICSSADNFEIRQTLRETWANTSEFNYSKFSSLHSHLRGKYLPINYPNWRNYTVSNYKESSDSAKEKNSDNIYDETSHVDFQIRTVFLIGQTENNETQDQILEESRIHNDLIQESFLDTYNNLTLKTVMMLKWINNNCVGKVKFLMKCDDDTFVHVPNLIHFLLGGTVPVYNYTLQRYNQKTIRTLSAANRLHQYENLLIGTRFCKSKPIRDFRSKWFAPRYMYDKTNYPNYLSGTAYVFTMDASEKLYNASMVMPILHLEDVYLTGICAENATITPQDHPLFNYLPYSHLCEVRGMITVHEIKSIAMRKAYNFVMKSNVTCSGPGRKATVRPLKKTYC